MRRSIIAALAAASIIGGMAGGATAAPKPNVILGSSANDTINGTNQNDVIFALKGDDRVNPGGGKDVVFAGRGNDVVSTWQDRRADFVRGGRGQDVCRIGPQDTARNCERVRVIG